MKMLNHPNIGNVTVAHVGFYSMVCVPVVVVFLAVSLLNLLTTNW